MIKTDSVAVLREVIRWAESRCPCYEEKPDPCTLCGASVANLEPCKAVDRIIPRDLLAKMRAALSAQGEEPATYGIRRNGETAIIGIVPEKIHRLPPTSGEYARDYEEVPLYLHPAPPGSDAVTWTPSPTKSGWYWHFDGDVTRMQFVFPRPGHSYLAVYDEPNPTTGKRNFRMAEKMGGQWCGPLTVPELPPAALAARTGKGEANGR